MKKTDNIKARIATYPQQQGEILVLVLEDVEDDVELDTMVDAAEVRVRVLDAAADELGALVRPRQSVRSRRSDLHALQQLWIESNNVLFLLVMNGK